MTKFVFLGGLGEAPILEKTFSKQDENLSYPGFGDRLRSLRFLINILENLWENMVENSFLITNPV